RCWPKSNARDSSEKGFMTLRIAAETPWYELFSRGARDWLRHNQKVREAVKESRPDLVASEDLITRPGHRTVVVPVRFLEQAGLRVADPRTQTGAGRGRAEPADALQRGREPGAEGAREGGTG